MNVYYVYVLFNWLFIPFYVGKGKGRRYKRNERWYNKERVETIDATKKILGFVPTIKFAENLDEETALKIERELIEEIGIQPDGPLVNKSSTGLDTTAAVKAAADYHRGRPISKEQSIKLSKASRGKPKSLHHREAMKQAAIRRWAREKEKRENDRS